MGDEKQEICTIRIMFSVTSDEQAIDCKKKIAAVLSEMYDVNIQFSLMNAPPHPPNGSRLR